MFFSLLTCFCLHRKDFRDSYAQGYQTNGSAYIITWVTAVLGIVQRTVSKFLAELVVLFFSPKCPTDPTILCYRKKK